MKIHSKYSNSSNVLQRAELHSFHLSAWGTPGTRSLSATSSMVLHCHLQRAHPRWFRWLHWFPSRRTSLLQSSRQFVGWCRKSVYARTWTEGMTLGLSGWWWESVPVKRTTHSTKHCNTFEIFESCYVLLDFSESSHASQLHLGQVYILSQAA